MKILILFNLKDGVSAEQYEQWARASELAKVNSLKSVDQFEIYKSTGMLFSEEKPPFAYFELLDVNDIEHFSQDAGSAEMQSTVETFNQMTDSAIFLKADKL